MKLLWKKKTESRKTMMQNKIIKILLTIAFVIFILFLAVYINHKIHLKKEASLLTPIGWGNLFANSGLQIALFSFKR